MPLKLTTYYHGSNIPELPGKNTFHSLELFHIYEATPGYTPLLIVASEAGRPVAKLLAAIRKSVRLFPPSIIKRCEICGTGEYFDETVDKEFVFGEILQRLTAEALREAFLMSFAIWKIRCSDINLSARIVTLPSTGYGYAIRYIVSNM